MMTLENFATFRLEYKSCSQIGVEFSYAGMSLHKQNYPKWEKCQFICAWPLFLRLCFIILFHSRQFDLSQQGKIDWSAPKSRAGEWVCIVCGPWKWYIKWNANLIADNSRCAAPAMISNKCLLWVKLSERPVWVDCDNVGALSTTKTCHCR